MSLFRRRRHDLPQVAPDVYVPPVPGSLEEALENLSLQDVDLEAFSSWAEATALDIRRALWASDVPAVSRLTTPSSRLRTLAQTSFARQRATLVSSLEVVDLTLVRAPENGRALTFRLHYVAGPSSVVHYVSHAVLEFLPSSHHKEDITFVRADELVGSRSRYDDPTWLVQDISVIS